MERQPVPHGLTINIDPEIEQPTFPWQLSVDADSLSRLMERDFGITTENQDNITFNFLAKAIRKANAVTKPHLGRKITVDFSLSSIATPESFTLYRHTTGFLRDPRQGYLTYVLFHELCHVQDILNSTPWGEMKYYMPPTILGLYDFIVQNPTSIKLLLGGVVLGSTAGIYDVRRRQYNRAHHHIDQRVAQLMLSLSEEQLVEWVNAVRVEAKSH